MRLKDTKTVKAMIDRMNAQGGTEVIANYGIVIHWDSSLQDMDDDGFATITNEKDVAELNAMLENYLTTGLTPSYMCVTKKVIYGDGNYGLTTNMYLMNGTSGMGGDEQTILISLYPNFDISSEMAYLKYEDGKWQWQYPYEP